MAERTGNPGWEIVLGNSPVIGTAIHSGSAVRSECQAAMALSDPDRVREEDPFTDQFIEDFPSRVIVHRSRFEVDLNRARDEAVYVRPEQSWGLKVWRETPADALVNASLDFHDLFYADLTKALRTIEQRFGRFVVIDVHSYNHRRDGADGEPTRQDDAPDINIGTFSMDRQRWEPVVDAFVGTLRGLTFRGKPIDVRENVAFQGKGEQTRFIHQKFPETGCAIAVEFKKIFMDEWSGEPDQEAIAALRKMLASTIPVLEAALRGGPR